LINTKDGNVLGFSSVYLEGERGQVRSQETNLGNLSADANAFVAKLAAGDGNPVVVSIKNGGGIRTALGEVSAPKADGSVDKLAPANGITQLGVEDALRFQNQLMTFDTTPEGLKAILEHGVAAGSTALAGQFPQIGGVVFSWDPAAAAGSRVRDIALDANGARINLYNDGTLLSGAPASIRVVTLNFLAQGGDNYPIKANGENFRYILQGSNGSLSLSAPVDEATNFFAAAPAGNLIETIALQLYVRQFHGTPQTAFAQADTPVARDGRIQNLSARSESVLASTENKIKGSTGDDTFAITSTRQRVSETASGGEDTLVSTVSIDLKRFKNVENVALIGTDNLGAVGSKVANELSGNAGSNRLDGLQGADVLIGGAGRDTFVFSVRDTATDVVSDFTRGSDTLAFAGKAFGQLNALKGATAISATDFARFFKFDGSTSVLSVDTNGSDAGGEVAVVRLTGVTALEASDVSVF
jgi:Ca2+-binding RTX toxin-like protein